MRPYATSVVYSVEYEALRFEWKCRPREWVSTDALVGPLRFDFVVSWHVAGLAKLSFKVRGAP
jgi:hypothetical protein